MKKLTRSQNKFIGHDIVPPLEFITKILKVKYITNEQRAIVESVWKNKYTGVKAAHNVGKTFIEACIVLAFLAGNKHSIVITTAPTARQVRDLLWAEINRLYSGSVISGRLGSIKQMSLNIGPKWFATGIATEAGKEEQSAVKLQGYHARKILVVLDEAVGVHPSIWEAVDGITSSEDAKILAVGNPSMINCAFKKHLDKKEWNCLSISALNHPNVIKKKNIIPGAVSYNWVKEKLAKWTDRVKSHDRQLHTFGFEGKTYKPNSLFLWKVLGEFPDDSTDSLIQLNKIQEAMSRTASEIVRQRNGELNLSCNLAIDVARFGTDYSVFALSRDNHIRTFPYFHLDTAKLSGEAIHLIRKYHPVKVAVDCDGVGAGVYDNLNEARSENKINCELVEIHGGANPLPLGQTEEFLNLRAQMYWSFKQDIDTISLDYNEELEEGLSSIKYFFNSKGKIQIESKDDIKRKLGRSPDLEDAIVYCNFLKHMNNTIGCALQEEDEEKPYTLLTERIGI
jgi:hypothetical protein